MQTNPTCFASTKIECERPLCRLNFVPSLFIILTMSRYYVSEHVLKGASAIGRKELALLGTCFGKFSGSGKFRLHITCLDYLAQVFTASLPSCAVCYVFILSCIILYF